MQRVLPERLRSLSFPAASPGTWEQLWTNHGPRWKQLVALLEAKLLERVSLGESVWELCEFGVTSDEGVPSSLSQGSSLSRSQEQAEPTTFPCEECGRVFRSSEALLSHAARKHGHRRWV